MNPIELNLFNSRLEMICEQMGEVLKHSAFSPNIRDRLDFSCAVFDCSGKLLSQAAHIPVHLGSMAYAMADLVNTVSWNEQEQVILNNPYLGGTHLPDVTLIAPVYVAGELSGFVVNRAHHADIGADKPGSMPISSTLHQEGVIISPSVIVRKNKIDFEALNTIFENKQLTETLGDIAAQVSANLFAARQLTLLVEKTGLSVFMQNTSELNRYAERLAQVAISKIPDGIYHFEDVMDDDGQGNESIPIKLSLTITGGKVMADFSGTAPQVKGNINCPLSVAAAGVFYVFRCLMSSRTPACSGAFESIFIKAPEGCLLNAVFPAAVAAGNVETSTRVVDVVLGALSQAIPGEIPAASHGSMNNVAMGSDVLPESWSYYETIGGGMGGHADGDGLAAVQTHMTNTLNTPIEVMEKTFPLRINRYQVRSHSGGEGRYHGGDGLLREYVFLKTAHLSVLSERRTHQPWGAKGGEPGQSGENMINGKVMPGKFEASVNAGDVLTIKTPGGGGYLQKVIS